MGGAGVKRPDSVVATDQEALRTLLTLHAVPNPRILDVTHNRGVMWKGLPYQPVSNDRDEGMPTDHHYDFRALPAEWSDAFDVVVFDPPHVTENGHSLGVEFVERYGLGGADLNTADIAHLFAPFLAEAKRVLVPDGVVLAKIADQVHRAHYRWQHVDLVVAARAAGFTACDLMLRLAHQRGGFISPLWKRIYHVRQVHTYWVVLRNGKACMSRHAPAVERELTAPMFAEVA